MGGIPVPGTTWLERMPRNAKLGRVKASVESSNFWTGMSHTSGRLLYKAMKNNSEPRKYSPDQGEQMCDSPSNVRLKMWETKMVSKLDNDTHD